MSRSPRLRRFFKWGGLSVSILFAVAWVASLMVSGLASVGRLQVAVLGGGLAGVVMVEPTFTEYGTKFAFLGSTPIRWLPEGYLFPRGGRPAVGFTAYVPFWCLFPLAAIPTVILWRRDRMIPPGHCQICGYDLTGNTTGVCSECGTTADSHAANSAGASAEQ